MHAYVQQVLQALREELTAQEEQHANQLAGQAELNARQLADLSAAHERQMASLSETHAKQLDVAKAAFERRLTAAAAMHRQESQVLKQEREVIASKGGVGQEALKQEANRVLEEAAARHSRELDEVKLLHELEIEDMKSRAEADHRLQVSFRLRSRFRVHAFQNPGWLRRHKSQLPYEGGFKRGELQKEI